MIRQGKEGSYNIFYKGLLISSFPIHKIKMIEGYNNQGIELIHKTLYLNHSLQEQIKIYQLFVNMIYKLKKRNKKISSEDHINFLNCFLALMKLKKIEEDDNNGILIMGRKKSRQNRNNIKGKF
tara:strand:- start:354 stop:725 length:372 start_codon:yes stop_codon:yes gene_type:complete